MEIVTQAIQFVANNQLSLSDNCALSACLQNQSDLINGAQYQRKLKMEEFYKWRVWTPYLVPMLKPKMCGKGNQCYIKNFAKDRAVAPKES